MGSFKTSMLTLQISLVLIAVVAIAGIYLYNLWQEYQLQKKFAEKSSDSETVNRKESNLNTALTKIEPNFGESAGRENMEFDGQELLLVDANERSELVAQNPFSFTLPPLDEEVECMVRLELLEPCSVVGVEDLLRTDFGKATRWFGWYKGKTSWDLLSVDNLELYQEIRGGLVLSDRNGPVTATQLQHFYACLEKVALVLPATLNLPDLGSQLRHAQDWDRFCADNDLQIALTILPRTRAQFKGSRLRGVCEANGLRLNGRGQFEYRDEQTGDLLCLLVNQEENQSLQASSIGNLALSGVVLLLDIPRLTGPVRAYHQVKVLAKRLAVTLEGVLVDDNRRPLNDAALQQIQNQIDRIVATLCSRGVEPGNQRAQLLFN